MPSLILESPSGEVKLDLVEQIGGDSLAVALEQDSVYLGIGPRLVVLSAASMLTEPQRIGQSAVLSGVVRDVHVANSLAYVAAGRGGLILLDVAHPSDIRTTGTVSVPGDARGVAVDPDGDMAYVVSGGQPEPGKGGILSIVDVSEPETPQQVASVETPGFARKVALIAHFVYVLCDGGLLVMDVSDPASPVEVVRADVPQGARAIATADGYVYVAGYGMQVFDVSDAAAPRQVSSSEDGRPSDAVAVQGELLYLADTFCEMGHCGSTIRISDVSDPSAPQEVGTWSTRSAIRDAVVHGDMLYLASWQKGLQVAEVSDPANPRLLGEYGTLPNVEDVAVSNGLIYLSDGAQSGLQVLELEAPGPRVRGTAESARWASGYAIVDGYAYVPMWLDGFRIIDVRAPDDLREVAAVDLDTAERAAVVGERAYVTTGYAGLAVLDVADPAAPRVLGELSLDGLAEGLAVDQDRAYVIVDGGEQDTLYVIDVADPSLPSEMGQVTLEEKGLNVALGPEGSHAYVAVADCTYYFGTPQCSGGLQVVDVRDPSLPRTALYVEVPEGAFDLAMVGKHAFVAAGHGGVWVLDVSDPEGPRAVGWAGTAGWPRSLVVADDLVYVADGEGGLLVLRARW